LDKERDDLWNARQTFGDDFVDTRARALTELINNAKARLKVLKEAASRIELKQFDGDAMKALAAEIDGVFAPDFDQLSATGTSILATLRNLVHKVVIDITDDSTEIEVQCKLAAVLENGTSGEIVKFRLRRERTGHAPLHSELRRIDAVVQAKTHALSDAAWEKISPLLPGCVARSKRGTDPVETRSVIDAALLHLNEGVPLGRMPAAFGERRAVFEGLRRLSSSGAWDVVVDVLRKTAPELIPANSTNMFSTVVGRYSTSLRGLPAIRARHGVEMTQGKFALDDAEWNLVSDLVPEQVLMVHREAARISPREFLHGLLYMLKSGAPISNMPLQLGSETYFAGCIKRLVHHGFWDGIVDRLFAASPTTLAGADLERLSIYPRSKAERTVWRGALAKKTDNSGIPSHFPTDAEWNAIKHLFPIELLYVNDKLAVDNPRRLAHALLYRIREKIPLAAFPSYFGDRTLLQLTFTKFVFHYLWDEMVAVLQAASPVTLKGADLNVFSKYKRARTRRYAHLLPAVEQDIPPHAPSDAHWELVKDLIPERLLVVRGRPAIMEPRRFLHALLFMASERVLFGSLPKHYFGSADDMKFATRKLVRHHLWDTMVARFAHFDEEWASGLDLTIFDKLPRSANENPEFREHRTRRPNKGVGPTDGGVEEVLVFASEPVSSGDAP
jgi:transposase